MDSHDRSTGAGQWLFRRRSYLPLALLVVVLPAFRGFSYPFGSHSYDLIWEMICLSISLLGLAIRAFTIGYVPKGTSGRNTRQQIADSLNTSGLYSVTRNPLYLGNFFMTLGVVMFLRNGWLGLVYALAFWLYYERIIAAEEHFLRDKFGGIYDDYLLRTPPFIPDFRLWRPPSVPFSLRNVLKREYSGFFGVIAAFTILEVAGDYVVEGKIEIDPVWAGIFLFGLAVYLLLLTLKKKTRLLRVEGR
jgi:protein-S-isoprenylcysteine O-methyltransferase Ste14